MDKESFGAALAEHRKKQGMKQRQLAEKLSVTDKAVSKWERGLSYPDVTLLQPLADALSVSVETLLRCEGPAPIRKDETMQEEQKDQQQPIQNLVELSSENLRRERRRSQKWIVAVAAILIVLTIVGNLYYRAEQNHYHSIENIDSIVWTASENGTAYIYIDLTEEDEILKLVAKGRVNISELACCTVYENPFYRMTYKYDDRTYEGTITSCEYVTTTYPNEPGPDSDDGFLLDEPLFGYLNTYCRRDVGNALLFYSVFDQSYEENGELHRVERIVSLVRVRGCSDAIYEVGDYDGDGENELIVKKYRSGLRYAYYDEPEGGVTKLLTEAEYQEMTAQ